MKMVDIKLIGTLRYFNEFRFLSYKKQLAILKMMCINLKS